MEVRRIAGGLGAARLMRKVALPDRSLYPLRVIAFAGVIYGVAALAHGSGFLAVFVAGIVLGDIAAPHKGEIERFLGSLANLGEIAAFVALGLVDRPGEIERDWRRAHRRHRDPQTEAG